MAKRIHLISCVGSNDPRDQRTGDYGPVFKTARLLQKVSKMDLMIHLVRDDGSSFWQNAENLKEELGGAFGKSVITQIHDVHLDQLDPYSAYRAFENVARAVMNEVQETDEAFVHISSGTSAMQVGWVLLVGSGRFPAHMVRSVPADFRRKRFSFDIEPVDLGSLPKEIFKECDSVRQIPKASKTGEARRLIDLLPESLSTKEGEVLIGKSKAMREVRALLANVAEVDIPVLLQGNTGTGKSLAAKIIQKNCARANEPFISISCAEIPKYLLESELFGHEKGSFTGAIASKAGLIEMADKGVLFLDEIGELEPSHQAKLLVVLNEKRGRRIGGRKRWKSDFRLITATLKNLKEQVEKGYFREDLYYRINEFSIRMPRLCERMEDLDEHVERIRDRIREQMRILLPPLNDGAWEILRSYDWPGNVRELEHALKKAAVMARKEKEVTPDDLPEEILESVQGASGQRPGRKTVPFWLKKALETAYENNAQKKGGVNWQPFVRNLQQAAAVYAKEDGRSQTKVAELLNLSEVRISQIVGKSKKNQP